MSSSIEIDDSEFPLVIATVPPMLCASMLDGYLKRMTGIMMRGPIAFIIDLRQLSHEGFSPELRQEFFRRIETRDATRGVHSKLCECLVAPSAIGQKILATYMWQVQPKGFELCVVSSLDEARAWSLAQLAEKGAGTSALRIGPRPV